MPITTDPTPFGALVCATMAPSSELLDAAGTSLEKPFGPAERSSATYPFDYTDYYQEEMGPGLLKRLTWFGQPVKLSLLAEAKNQTMMVESTYASPSKSGPRRRVNADPGLLTIDSLVLATTKHSGHRICIAESLYAEVTLLYEKGRYAPMPWTYMDYKNDAVQDFLLEVRKELLRLR